MVVCAASMPIVTNWVPKASLSRVAESVRVEKGEEKDDILHPEPWDPRTETILY